MSSFYHVPSATPLARHTKLCKYQC